MISVSDLNDENSDYIGDGAYAHIDKGNRLWVITYDGLNILDKICLEDEVFAALYRFYNNRILSWRVCEGCNNIARLCSCMDEVNE